MKIRRVLRQPTVLFKWNHLQQQPVRLQLRLQQVPYHHQSHLRLPRLHRPSNKLAPSVAAVARLSAASAMAGVPLTILVETVVLMDVKNVVAQVMPRVTTTMCAKALAR